MTKQLPNLYVMRFFLALIVVFSHVPATSRGSGLPYFENTATLTHGRLAVFYFFTLSGFLIIRLLYLELRSTNTINIPAFYNRRIRRLYPVYYLVLAMGLVVYELVLPRLSVDYASNVSIVELILHYVFFIPNVYVMNNPDTSLGLTVLWSIGVEEQFYLAMPLIALLAKSRLIPVMCAVLTLLLLLLVFTNFYASLNYYFYFIAGGLASVMAEKGWLGFLKSRFIQLVFFALFAITFFTSYLELDNNVLYHLTNMIIAAVCVTAISYYPIFLIRSKSLNYFGKISFGVYMYHPFALSAIVLLFSKMEVVATMPDNLVILLVHVLTIAGALITAALSFEYFEKRFYKPNGSAPRKTPEDISLHPASSASATNHQSAVMSSEAIIKDTVAEKTE